MADFIVKLFKIFRQLIGLSMCLLIVYSFCGFLDSVSASGSSVVYMKGDVNIIPIIHIAVTMIVFNLLVLFLFGPKGSTLCTLVLAGIWNTYVWMQVCIIETVGNEGLKSIYKWDQQMLETSIAISAIIIIFCLLLEYKSRIRMGWKYY